MKLSQVWMGLSETEKWVWAIIAGVVLTNLVVGLTWLVVEMLERIRIWWGGW